MSFFFIFSKLLFFLKKKKKRNQRTKESEEALGREDRELEIMCHRLPIKIEVLIHHQLCLFTNNQYIIQLLFCIFYI